jgi:hypothetical protein
MAPEKHDLAATRERLEFLLESDGHKSRVLNTKQNARSTQRAFIAGAAFSGLVASSIFLTNYIDSKLHETAAKADASAVISKISSVPSIPILNGAPNSNSLETGTSGSGGSAIPNIGTSGVQTPISSRESPTNLSAVETRQNGFAALPAVPDNSSSVISDQQVKRTLVPIAGLSTSRSVITGVVDPLTMTASYYWTFTLKNQTDSSKEAQMNIALPNGAVVSRATLWINGRAEEAAFNSTNQVQNAYDWIVSRNRDPLLITQTEDGNINLKASPVMPNKEMKIRVGITTPMEMTADGHSQMALPHIIDANLNVYCNQNVHITAEVPLTSSDSRMTSPSQKKGFLLRGNVNAGDLKALQITAQRDPSVTKFATRATHSNPPGYIIAELQKDKQGLSKLNLTKSMSKPNCTILNDDHAAFRLSYLWVKKEIERLVERQEQGQAEQLATVYRVVSPVSGAVVLERQSDYDYNGLDRNMYKALAYEAQKSQDDVANRPMSVFAEEESSISTRASVDLQRIAPKAAAPQGTLAAARINPFDKTPALGGNSDASSGAPHTSAKRKAEHNSESIKRDMLANKRATQPAPVEEKAGRKQFAKPQTEVAMAFTGSSTTPIETANFNSTEMQSNKGVEKVMRLAGPIGSKLHTNAKNLNTLFLSDPLSTSALLTLLALTFAGGSILYALAAQRFYRRQPGALQLAAGGAIWVTVAAIVPLFSQVFSVLLAIALIARLGWKAIHREAD